MAVRKTEGRIPAGFQPGDLGEAVVAGDSRCALVSFVTSPIVTGRENVYVLFVTDPGLVASADSYDWSVSENAGAPVVTTTEHGEFSYVPSSIGELNLSVRILDTGGEQAVINLRQDVVAPNVELEGMISDAKNAPGPGVGSPDVARELVNNHNPYYQGVLLSAPEAGTGFQQFVFSMVFGGAGRRTELHRKQHLEQLAASINDASTDLVTLATTGAGVSGLRLALLAMTLPGMLDFTELPEPVEERGVAEEELRRSLAELTEAQLVDLFNLVRFPKSNIVLCGRILESLRDRYFPGVNFNDVLTGMGGTRAHWIARHYLEGPLRHT